jgi:hypothetical protein
VSRFVCDFYSGDKSGLTLPVARVSVELVQASTRAVRDKRELFCYSGIIKHKRNA